MSERKVYRSQTEYRKSILTNAAIVTVISLIPGLKISSRWIPRRTEPAGGGYHHVFSGDDLKTAESIQAALTLTQEVVETIRRHSQRKRCRLLQIGKRLLRTNKRFKWFPSASPI
jgi:hypothetical protein